MIRQHILKDILNIYLDLNNSEQLLRLLIDCSAVIDSKTVSAEVIFHIRCLCYALHIERYRRLSVVPGRKRNRKT